MDTIEAVQVQLLYYLYLSKPTLPSTHTSDLPMNEKRSRARFSSHLIKPAVTSHHLQKEEKHVCWSRQPCPLSRSGTDHMSVLQVGQGQSGDATYWRLFYTIRPRDG